MLTAVPRSEHNAEETDGFKAFAAVDIRSKNKKRLTIITEDPTFTERKYSKIRNI